jgi:hypothetical protein
VAGLSKPRRWDAFGACQAYEAQARMIHAGFFLVSGAVSIRIEAMS